MRDLNFRCALIHPISIFHYTSNILTYISQICLDISNSFVATPTCDSAFTTASVHAINMSIPLFGSWFHKPMAHILLRSIRGILSTSLNNGAGRRHGVVCSCLCAWEFWKELREEDKYESLNFGYWNFNSLKYERLKFWEFKIWEFSMWEIAIL